MRRWMVAGCFILLWSHMVWAQSSPRPILIKPKIDSKFRLRSGAISVDEMKRVVFHSEQEKSEYVQNLDSQEVEFEDVVEFHGDLVSIGDQAAIAQTEDPLVVNQWSIFPTRIGDQYQASDIDVLRAHTLVTGSSHVVIYVIDSGIAPPDLEPDLNGRVTSYFNAFSPGAFPVDENNHGTHVSSIAAARGDNGVGILGIASGNIQLAVARFLNAQNKGDTQSVLSALQWAEADMAARRAADPQVKFIFNFSFGGRDYSSFLENQLNRLAAYRPIFVSSAGNENGDNDQQYYYPCQMRIPYNLCVGATDEFDRRASFSSYGAHSVHLFAPGRQIYGVIRGTMNGNTYQSRYGRLDGTSQAVPHVVGTAALAWSANLLLGAQDIQNIMVQSVDRIPGLQNLSIGGGRVNAYRAVLMAMGRDPSEADRIFGASAESAQAKAGCSLSVRESAASIPASITLGLGLFIFLIGVLRRRYRRCSINS